MRDKFRGYYAPTEEELHALWGSATIVLDANVLLDFHRYEAATSATYLELATFFSARLWLPFQAAYEYHENRIAVRADTTSIHKEQIASIEKLVKAIEQPQRKSHLRTGEKHRALLAAARDLLTELNRDSEHLSDLNGPTADDPVLAKITTLYEGRIGDEPSKETLIALHDAAAERFSNNVPPGYKDQNKEGNRKYGDYILWQEVLDHAKAQRTDVILVTEDAKEDWWVSTQGKQIMPRPELIKEFREFTEGRSIHLYNGLSFFNYAARHASTATNRARIAAAREELEEVAQQRADEQANDDLHHLWHTKDAKDDNLFKNIKPLNNRQLELLRLTGGTDARSREKSIAMSRKINNLETQWKKLSKHVAAREKAGAEPWDPAIKDLNSQVRHLRLRIDDMYAQLGLTWQQQKSFASTLSRDLELELELELETND